MFSGLGIAAVYKFIADGLKVFPSEITYDVTAYKAPASASMCCPLWPVSATSAA